MARVRDKLHSAFLDALQDNVVGHSDVTEKPLLVELAHPSPYRLRVYLYSLVMGAAARKNELKAVLRLPGQPRGEYASFDFSDDRIVILAGYREDLDVFILWDASLRRRFKNGDNIQAKDETVLAASIKGFSQQHRQLASGQTEVIFGCRPKTLVKAISARVGWTGGAD